jgi:hypothetical protein
LPDLSSSNASHGFFSLASSSLLVQRTNLLSPSVAHLPVFKVALAATTETYNVKFSAICQALFGKKAKSATRSFFGGTAGPTPRGYLGICENLTFVSTVNFL